MFEWQITKYDPQFRDASGVFQKDEWTSISDIGEFYSGKKFSFDEYISVENAYVDAILSFMSCIGLSFMRIVGLEKRENCKNFNPQQKDLLKVFTEIKTNQDITKEIISIVCRLILREKMWCKLEAQDMFVHFGYDYYMFVGASKECKQAKSKIRESGLFIEPFESPYKILDSDS